MRTESLPPGPFLLESMRAVGYSFPTAIADIVDNSIAARATRVDVSFSGAVETPFVAILDNGYGMDDVAARAAMRLAGSSAGDARRSEDLGRFGLGLKTASLSQCRRLTLVSKCESGEIVALRWDLVHISHTGGWDLIVLEEAEIRDIPGFGELSNATSGTLVVWQDLDRLAAQEQDLSSILDDLMVDVRSHIALVFHRFLSGDDFPRVSMTINLFEIEPADPFLSKSARTQPSPVERISVAGADIQVRAYTLPYVVKMTSSERRRATANGDLRDTQGFYVYRAGRLVIWGTWFRLIPRRDLTKLTRVKVDIPNSLDHLWALDIKKSTAMPPVVVRERLRSLAATFVQPSETVHNYRGRNTTAGGAVEHGWNVIVDRDATKYTINRDHPIMRGLASSLDNTGLRVLEDALIVLESTLPLQDIHNRMAVDKVDLSSPDDAQLACWRGALERIWHLSRDAESLDSFLDRMLAAEPFDALRPEREKLLHTFSGADLSGV